MPPLELAFSGSVGGAFGVRRNASTNGGDASRVGHFQQPPSTFVAQGKLSPRQLILPMRNAHIIINSNISTVWVKSTQPRHMP